MQSLCYLLSLSYSPQRRKTETHRAHIFSGTLGARKSCWGGLGEQALVSGPRQLGCGVSFLRTSARQRICTSGAFLEAQKQCLDSAQAQQSLEHVGSSVWIQVKQPGDHAPGELIQGCNTWHCVLSDWLDVTVVRSRWVCSSLREKVGARNL